MKDFKSGSYLSIVSLWSISRRFFLISAFSFFRVFRGGSEEVAKNQGAGFNGGGGGRFETVFGLLIFRLFRLRGAGVSGGGEVNTVAGALLGMVGS